MKKTIATLATLSLLSAGAFAYASAANTEHNASKTAPATLAKKQQQQSILVKVYSRPSDGAAVVDTIDVAQRVVPFFRRGDWMKVGNPEDGKVGWINKEEYRRAMNENFHRSVQMVYVEVNQEKGKPEIIAYQNGEKLKPAQAKELYEKLQRQQANLSRQLHEYQQEMDHWFWQDANVANAALMSVPPMPMMLQPMIVIDQPQQADNQSAAKANQSKSKKAPSPAGSQNG